MKEDGVAVAASIADKYRRMKIIGNFVFLGLDNLLQVGMRACHITAQIKSLRPGQAGSHDPDEQDDGLGREQVERGIDLRACRKDRSRPCVCFRTRESTIRMVAMQQRGVSELHRGRRAPRLPWSVFSYPPPE
jgi:hypothetical protein